MGGLGQVGQVCRIALGVVLRCVGYLVLVTFWGAVPELLSHLQQASPRGPSCLLNQSLGPVIRGPMHHSMQGAFGWLKDPTCCSTTNWRSWLNRVPAAVTQLAPAANTMSIYSPGHVLGPDQVIAPTVQYNRLWHGLLWETLEHKMG